MWQLINNLKLRKCQITCNCPGRIYNTLLLYIESNVECLDSRLTVSQYKNQHQKRFCNLVTSKYGFFSYRLLLVEQLIYKFVMGNFCTGFLINKGLSMFPDKKFCPKTSTIKKLLQMDIYFCIVYVKRTLACKKSIMVTFFRHQYVIDLYKHHKVVLITWTQTNLLQFEQLNLQNGLAYLKANDWVFIENTLIIIHKVQVLFKDISLWSNLIKLILEHLCKTSLMIVLFGSYRSLLTGPRHGTIPVTFAPNWRVFL